MKNQPKGLTPIDKGLGSLSIPHSFLALIFLLSCGNQPAVKYYGPTPTTSPTLTQNTQVTPTPTQNNQNQNGSVDTSTQSSTTNTNTPPKTRICKIPVQLSNRDTLSEFLGASVFNLEAGLTMCLEIKFANSQDRSDQIIGHIGFEFEDEIGYTQVELYSPDQYRGKLSSSMLSIVFVMLNSDKNVIGVTKLSGAISENGFLNAQISFRRIDPTQQEYTYTINPGIGYINPNTSMLQAPKPPARPMTPAQAQQYWISQWTQYWEQYYQSLQASIAQNQIKPDFNAPWNEAVNPSKHNDVKILGSFEIKLTEIIIK